jgi:phosphatidylserine decarboxylase
LTPTGVFLRKGEEIGMFEMGSTIVMMFECPESTTFTVKEGDKLLLG